MLHSRLILTKNLLYDDDGTTYQYEQGEYSRIEIIYHDNTRTVETKELQNGGYAKPLDFVIL